MPLWNCQYLQRALSRGPHHSSLENIDFLQEEFVDMINKGQWVILPAKAVLHLPGFDSLLPGLSPNVAAALVGFVTTAGGGSTKTPSPLL